MAERDPRHPQEPLPAAGLIALLDLMERPAAAIGDAGTLLGVSQRFHEFAHIHGRAPHDRLEGLLQGPSLAAVQALLRRRGPLPRQTLQLEFRDGTRAGALAELLVTETGAPLLLLVVDAAAERAGVPLRGTASLRHDIAGPLTAILGTAELLILRQGDSLSVEVRASLDKIVENCGRITEILQKSRATERGGGES